MTTSTNLNKINSLETNFVSNEFYNNIHKFLNSFEHKLHKQSNLRILQINIRS